MAITLWVKYFREVGNTLIYERIHPQRVLERKKAYNELMENMDYARKHCAGEFNAIVAQEDTLAHRQRLKCAGLSHDYG